MAILGAGVSGLCMGIQLKKAGIESFTIFEKSERVGGTWWENQYPGAACDVPSHFYCYSFEPNPDWSRKFSPQPEIQRYLERTAEKYGIAPHIRFGTEIAGASFDERAAKWRVRTKSGEEFVADVSGERRGAAEPPVRARPPGPRRLRGQAVPLRALGRDVTTSTARTSSCIGNGASAIQFIPKVAAAAKKLTILQRSANWVVPRGDYAYSERAKRVFRALPWLTRMYRYFFYWQLEKNYMAFAREGYWARWFHKGASMYLEAAVPDPGDAQEADAGLPRSAASAS